MNEEDREEDGGREGGRRNGNRKSAVWGWERERGREE